MDPASRSVGNFFLAGLQRNRRNVRAFDQGHSAEPFRGRSSAMGYEEKYFGDSPSTWPVKLDARQVVQSRLATARERARARAYPVLTHLPYGLPVKLHSTRSLARAGARARARNLVVVGA